MTTAPTELTVRASRGHDYHLTRDDRGVVRLQRQTVAGKTVTIVFSRADVINVANGLVDILEAE